MGSTLSTAVFGTILTLRFLPEMRAAVPAGVAAHLDGGALEAIRDPQALLSPVLETELRLAIAQRLPEVPDAADLVFAAIRAGLAGSLHWVFLGSALVLVLALLVSCFIREIPLRGRGSRSEATEARLSTVAKPA
jgi:hypothetical protein